ncbi:MAG TPA: hypothetical protein VMW72_25415 [Sedimentisphaerales bacterium]|nr:hypothetical protein [Sedimentisphaerales bacterium]
MGNETPNIQQMMESHKCSANVLAISSGKAAKFSKSMAAQPGDEGFMKKVINRFF